MSADRFVRVHDVTLSDACRERHGDQGAVFLAAVELVGKAAEILLGWERGRGLRLRFCLEYERPEPSSPDEPRSREAALERGEVRP